MTFLPGMRVDVMESYLEDKSIVHFQLWFKVAGDAHQQLRSTVPFDPEGVSGMTRPLDRRDAKEFAYSFSEQKVMIDMTWLVAEIRRIWIIVMTHEFEEWFRVEGVYGYDPHDVGRETWKENTDEAL